MKRLITLLFILMLWVGSSWATTVQIGSGTTTTSYFPIYTCYGYNYSQQIYYASEIVAGGGGAGQITQIKFYYNAGGTTYSTWPNWTVYLGNSTKTTFTSTTDWVPVAQLTQVFSGNIPTPVAGTWLTLTLSTPFNYTGDNLIVAVDENTPSYSCTASWRSFASGANRGILYYSDTSNPDPAAPPTANYGPNATLSQIQLEILSGDCTGTPDPGNTLSSSNPACSGVNFTLSLQNAISGQGVNYQWQSSPTGADPWAPIGTNSPQCQTSQTEATSYRCEVTCTSSGLTGTSIPIEVTMSNWYDCYCEANASTCDEYIGQVIIGDIDNTTACTPGGYTDYTAFSTDLMRSVGYAITVNNPVPYSTDQCSAWGDWNQDGDFYDTGETFVLTNDGTGAQFTGTIIPPADAVSGTTRLRIRLMYTGDVLPCGGTSYGEVEDYSVNVIETAYGTLEGYVYSMESSCVAPLAGATVSDGINTTTTDGDGFYQFPGSIPIGTYTFTASLEGYVSQTISGIVITASTTTIQNFCLGYGVIGVAPEFFEVTLITDATVTENLTISNSGLAELTWQAFIGEGAARSATMGNPNPNRNVITSENRPDASWDGGSKSSGSGTREFETCPGTSQLSYPPATTGWNLVTSEVGPGYAAYQYFTVSHPITEMTFWGGNMFFNGTSWISCDTEDPMVFTIKFYNDAGGFPGSEIASYTPTITRVNTNIALSTYGFLYMYSFTLPSSLSLPNGWVSVVGQTATPDCWFMWDITSDVTATPYLQWTGTAYGLGTAGLSLCFGGSNLWLTLDSYSGTILPSQNVALNALFNATDMAVGTYEANVEIYHNGQPAGTVVVPATMIVEGALCPRPTAMEHDLITSSGATLIWTDNVGTSWELYIVAAGSPAPDGTTVPTVDALTDTSYVWTGGSPSTAYDWYVRTDCGTDVSLWRGPDTFTTPLCNAEDMCTYTVMEIDSWGDGWNGNILGFRQNGQIVATFGAGFTDGSSFGPEDANLCDNLVTEIVVVTLGSYTSEVGFTVYDPDGGILFDWPTGTTFNATTVFHTFTTVCVIACPVPTLLTAVPDVYSASLDWTENGTAALWDIEYGEAPYTFTGTATLSDIAKPYNLSGLLDGTSYEYKVRANCGTEYSNWSTSYTFATLPSCQLPTGLNAPFVGPTSADLTWISNGSGTTWNVELGPTGFNVGTGAAEFEFIETENNPLNAPGLAEGTTYDFYVQEICGFVNPKIDYFFMAMDENSIIDPNPLVSGGATQVLEPGETMEWVLYDQVSPSWYNIWFYNDPLDINKMKRIRMGFWIQRLNPEIPANFDYVVNWSTDGWTVPGTYPGPMDELYIERSEPHGQTEILETAQWVELYYTIPDYNPEWVSIDIWGSNIVILNAESEPPMESPLHPWWAANRGNGGIIVHECLPKPYGDVSEWAGPYSFTTLCTDIIAPYSEEFTTWIPSCWDTTGGNKQWIQYNVGSIQCARANFWFQTAGSTDILTSYTLDVSGLTNPVLAFDWSHLYSLSYPNDTLNVLVSDDNGVNWTTVWSKGNVNFNSNDGAGTTAPGSFVPSGDIDLSLFGNSLLVRFYGKSGFGPDAFVDNVFVGEACLVNDWTGAVSNDWNDPANWACGRVPSLLQDVEIPVGVANFPIIPAGVTAHCYSINVEPGATIIVQTGGTLNIVNP